MLPNDLGLGVALYPSRTRVPVRHHAVRVEHEDGIVGDPLHEQPEALLTLAERLTISLLRADVPRDLGEADRAYRTGHEWDQ